jgi:hypothetical protein
MKIEIKNRFIGSIIFSIETDSIKLAVEAAIKSKADLSSADLSYANLRSADLSYADLSYANLSYANLSYANLSYANLRSADLSYANLRSANLRSADLRSADLSYANLSSANLSYANLSSANLRSADLRSANLRSADLRSADLSSANLSYANLRSADLNKLLSTPLYMMLDQPGKIRAYKLVKPNGEGPYNGGIIYEIGKRYEIEDANQNETDQCGSGINLATMDWCLREWREGYRIFIAEFEAKDIAAIPIGSDGKLRVYRCQIVGEKSLKELGWPPTKQGVSNA